MTLNGVGPLSPLAYISVTSPGGTLKSVEVTDEGPENILEKGDTYVTQCGLSKSEEFRQSHQLREIAVRQKFEQEFPPVNNNNNNPLTPPILIEDDQMDVDEAFPSVPQVIVPPILINSALNHDEITFLDDLNEVMNEHPNFQKKRHILIQLQLLHSSRTHPANLVDAAGFYENLCKKVVNLTKEPGGYQLYERQFDIANAYLDWEHRPSLDMTINNFLNPVQENDPAFVNSPPPAQQNVIGGQQYTFIDCKDGKLPPPENPRIARKSSSPYEINMFKL
ncbi:MAG: hypothetical protein Q8K75_08755 [Chlamydiales bacterium]|nr:hypothetical protein [Chlamydiales bacterium]